MRKKQFTTVIVLLIVMVFIISVCIPEKANAKDNVQYRNKYYTSITINEGDSLWGIAQRYMSEEYDDINDYIDEIKSINNLDSDEIHAGNNLIVAYYSDEIK